jgi:hypothetical protein
LDNGKKQQMTRSASYDAQPVWNKSGDAFLFFRIMNNKKQIWIRTLDSVNESPITPDNVLSRGAVWIN